MDFKEKFKALHEVSGCMSKEKFILLCLSAGIEKSKITEYYGSFLEGLFTFIREVPESFLDPFLGFRQNIDISLGHSFSVDDKLYRVYNEDINHLSSQQIENLLYI